MKALVISKPIYDFVLPLVEFPQDGDTFVIDSCVNTLSTPGCVAACTLGKYGIDTSFTGVVGEDEEAKKIKKLLESYQLDCKYVETNYEEHTCIGYKIYNSKSNKFTTVNKLSLKSDLTKYKYEFIPDKIIMDDRDYTANVAALNNFPEAMTIFIGERFGQDTLIYCNKCKYIICNLNFASTATGVVNGLNRNKNIVTLFQKFIDLYSANLIIKLDNFDVLYVLNDEVRIIKNVNKNIANKENVFYGLLSYFLINDYDVETAIKLTNKAMLSSANEIDILKDIPDYSVIEKIKTEQANIVKEQEKMQNAAPATNNVAQNNTNATPQQQNQVNETVQTTQTQANAQQVQNVQQANVQQTAQVQNTAPAQNVAPQQVANNQNNSNVNGVNNGQSV